MDRPLLRWAFVAFATAVAGILLVAIVRSTEQPAALEVRLPEAPASDGVIKIYVSGAVLHPGIYQLQTGDRYADALAAAGGPTEEADALAVNMAKRVRDEDHIHVPRKGEGAVGATVSGADVLDLNTANTAQLEALPGIGAVRARQIVESRTRDGAFSRIEDLTQRKLVPQSTLDQLRDLVRVR